MAGRKYICINPSETFLHILVTASLPGRSSVRWPRGACCWGVRSPTPAPRCAIRLTRENLVYRSGCPLGSGRRSGRGGRLPGQLCPTQIWCVSLQCRSAFAGQLEASWKPVDPGPWPSFPSFSSCPKQVNRPKEHEEAIRTDRKKAVFPFCSQMLGRSQA